MRARVVAFSVALLLTAAPSDAASASTPAGIPWALSTPARALARLHRLEARFAELRARYSALEREAGRAALRVVSALRAEQRASDALAAAQRELADRVRAAYELGAGGAIEAFLSMRSFQDLLSVQEFAGRAIGVDQQEVERLRQARAALRARTLAAERTQHALLPEQRRLSRLSAQMRTDLAHAERVAQQAGLRDASLERQRGALEEAAARQVGRNLIVAGSTGIDQSQQLALLGPNEGRGCEIPGGMRDTGKSFSGDASWYGWDFAGQPTADGAIFDPRLFTAANRWLPFGTYLRVHYNGNCAIVLVNDRGPYGDDSRVIDLSEAAAHYLGVGVSPVTADILVPKGTASWVSPYSARPRPGAALTLARLGRA